mmetsp:Transcript_38155/g.107816  ORF Transcript_38155/g.107816 Transcript_38155/m.107816 type:complete len:226 (+) Transcript_38155:293-970(+)
MSTPISSSTCPTSSSVSSSSSRDPRASSSASPIISEAMSILAFSFWNCCIVCATFWGSCTLPTSAMTLEAEAMDCPTLLVAAAEVMLELTPRSCAWLLCSFVIWPRSRTRDFARTLAVATSFLFAAALMSFFSFSSSRRSAVISRSRLRVSLVSSRFESRTISFGSGFLKSFMSGFGASRCDWGICFARRERPPPSKSRCTSTAEERRAVLPLQKRSPTGSLRRH